MVSASYKRGLESEKLPFVLFGGGGRAPAQRGLVDEAPSRPHREYFVQASSRLRPGSVQAPSRARRATFR